MATIITKNSSTASSVPTNAQLVQGELAVNVTDKRLFTENASGTVVELGTNPSSLTLPNGTANGVAYLNGSKVLTTGSALTFDGTNFGIGTSSPVAKLQVAGSAFITGRSVPSSGVGMEAYWSGTQSYLLSFDRTTPAYKPFVIDGSTISLAINGANTLNLDSSGNLGLGVTPSAWGSSGKVLEIGVAGNALWGRTATELHLGQNYYNNSSNQRIYASSNKASDYSQEAGAHYWFTAPSGTAGGTITFTQAMTLDASGRLGVGSTSPECAIDVLKASSTDDAGRYSIRSFDSTSAASGVGGGIAFTGYYNGTSSAANFATIQGIKENGTAGNFASAMVFTTRANGGGLTERARIDSSGNLLVGKSTTAATTTGTVVTPAGRTNIATSSGEAIYFYYSPNGTNVGSITHGTTTTSYNTSSDYRLKEDIQPMTGALAKVAALKPVTYKWKVDGSDGDGFIAHELAEVVPQCVTGEKDAVDAEGNPVYQGIDTSFLVATLTAAIQELKAEFDAYKAAHP